MKLSREARGLVEAARRQGGGPTAAQRDRIRRAALVAMATGTVAGATATASSAAAAVATGSGLSLAGKLGVGLFALAVAGGGAALISRASTDSAAASPPATSHAVSPTAPAAPPTSAPAEARVPSVVASSEAPSTASGSREPARPALVPSLEPSVATADSLAEETALLRAAQSALGSGRAAEALAALDQHQTRFPKGVLALEQRALRAMALCASGQTDAGRALSSALSASAPGSPLAERVSTACR